MKQFTKDRIDVVTDAATTERAVIRATYEFHNLMGQRKGQALMNALRHVAPDLYEIISGTDADCFYDDRKMAQTLGVLGYSNKIFNDLWIEEKN